MKMMRTKAEVLDHLRKIGYHKPGFRIAVEALIFTPEGKILLQKRGPHSRDEIGKLEGVGGSLGDREDLLQELREEIDQELSAQAVGLEIVVDRLFEIRQVEFYEQDHGLQNWVIVSFLCRIKKGKPEIGEPGKTESLHEFTLSELQKKEEDELSKSTIGARRTYQDRYGNRPYYEVLEEGEE
ncbi:MAG: NUDIX domain-containing protein [Chloroflexi bacterium]|nr:NUDIX domain-containing protein [Chloroflexota bacterium]